ncbi:MAG: nucleotidyltransferase family protein [Anaerolineae bacterium]
MDSALGSAPTMKIFFTPTRRLRRLPPPIRGRVGEGVYFQRSDLDFLVEFADFYALGAFDRYFGLKEDLEQLFQRPVDLVEVKAIRNPYFLTNPPVNQPTTQPTHRPLRAGLARAASSGSPSWTT